MNGNEWCERYGVAFDWTGDGSHRDSDGWEHNLFTLTLEREGVTLELSFRTGLGVDMGDGPTAELLWMHASDVRTGELRWEDYADEYGYDHHDAPLSAYRTWEACREERKRIYDFCDSQAMWEDFCDIAEDDQ